jgi:ferritin
MLSKKIEAALNEQIKWEAYACSSYLAMATWCETNGLRHSAGFFYQQSDEERVHMLKLVRHINCSQGYAIIPEIEEPANKYKSLYDIFASSLKQEQSVTASISHLVDLSFNNKDYMTFNFLQWYVAEQHEEENLFSTILDIFKIAGEPPNLLLIDQEIASIRAEEEDEEEEE